MKLVNCVGCGKELPIDKRSDTKWCSKLCGNRVRNRNYYKNNPDKFVAQRIKHNSDISKRIFTRVKSRAKIKEIPFNLDIEDIIVPETCPVLGIKIQQESGTGTNPIHSPSLDRINPNLGYIKGNVRVISNRANLLKSNATIKELEMVLKDAKSLI